MANDRDAIYFISMRYAPREGNLAADFLQLALMARGMKEAFPGIELSSVDGFQGREKEAIIVTMVRSNDNKECGFLGEKRRLNGEFPSFNVSWIVWTIEMRVQPPYG